MRESAAAVPVPSTLRTMLLEGSYTSIQSSKQHHPLSLQEHPLFSIVLFSFHFISCKVKDTEAILRADESNK